MAGNQDVGLTVVSVVSEILSASSLPGSSVLQRAVDKAYERRKQTAVDALLEAVAEVGPENVQFGEEDADELVQMLLRYGKAAMEGVAKQNLKLLAQVICGLKSNKTLVFDEFQECANALESLTREEILFLGKYYNFLQQNITDNRLLDYMKNITDKTEREDIEMTAASLQRSGLMLPISVFSATDYTATSKLYKICKLARI